MITSEILKREIEKNELTYEMTCISAIKRHMVLKNDIKWCLEHIYHPVLQFMGLFFFFVFFFLVLRILTKLCSI